MLLFHSTVCEDEWTKRFLRGLQGKLRHLEIKQHCKFQLASAFCFPSLSNRSDEFIVQVQLEGKAPGRRTTAESPRDNGGSGVE